MLRLIKYLMIVLFLCSLPMLAKLYLSNAQERAFYIVWMKLQVQPVLERVGWITAELEGMTAETLAERVRAGGQQLQHIAACGKTETLEIEEAQGSQIYQWKDQQGQTHFSDTQPVNTGSDALSAQYVGAKQYFNLNIIEDTSSLPAFAKDRVSADVQQIYDILSKDLGLDHLRRVFLNVRIIETQADFQEYKNKIAPRARTESGFYSSQHNEAVVFQGNDSAHMRAVIRHESSHVITAGLYGYTPVWLNEGLAEYFENLQLAGQKREINPIAHHLTHLRSRIAQDDLVPVSRYLSMLPAQWYEGDLKDHYAMAWSMVYFLMSSKDGREFLRTALDQLAINFCGGLKGSALFADNYPGGIARFESQWESWLASGEPAAHRY